jgi:hypothetical protein
VLGHFIVVGTDTGFAPEDVATGDVNLAGELRDQGLADREPQQPVGKAVGPATVSAQLLDAVASSLRTTAAGAAFCSARAVKVPRSFGNHLCLRAGAERPDGASSRDRAGSPWERIGGVRAGGGRLPTSRTARGTPTIAGSTSAALTSSSPLMRAPPFTGYFVPRPGSAGAPSRPMRRLWGRPS